MKISCISTNSGSMFANKGLGESVGCRPSPEPRTERDTATIAEQRHFNCFGWSKVSMSLTSVHIH